MTGLLLAALERLPPLFAGWWSPWARCWRSPR